MSQQPTFARRDLAKYAQWITCAKLPHIGSYTDHKVYTFFAKCVLLKFSVDNYNHCQLLWAPTQQTCEYGQTLGQRRRQWSDSKPTLTQRLMFAGWTYNFFLIIQTLLMLIKICQIQKFN